MAKSFADFFGQFTGTKDKLMYAMGELVQIPERCNRLTPRIETFINSTNSALQDTGKKLLTRVITVRTLANSEYFNSQKLVSEMLAFKDSVEKNPLYTQMMNGTITSNVGLVLSSFFDKADKGNLAFFQSAALKAVNLAGRGATALSSLSKASTEIKALEALAQQTADYGQGKGFLPVVDTAVDQSPTITKTMWVAGLGIAGLAIYLLKGRK